MNLSPSERGEAEVVIEGETYRLAFDLHAMAVAEDYVESVLGRYVPFEQIQKDIEQYDRKRYVIAVFYASTRRHHRDITPERAAELVQRSMEESRSVSLQQAMAAAGADTVPDERDVKELGIKRRRPRKAQVADGTGGSLNSTPVSAA